MNLRMARALRCLLLLASLSMAALASALPGWADRALAEAGKEAPPARAAAWVLLDRSEFLYDGRGGIQVHRWKVVRVLSAAGTGHATYFLWGQGGRDHQVESVQGWNLTPAGKLTRVEGKSAIQFDPDRSSILTSDMGTAVHLEEVVPGSIVAYESLEILRNGLTRHKWVAGADPILRWELEADSKWFVLHSVPVDLQARNLERWTREVETVPGRSIKARHVPGLDPALPAVPGAFQWLPVVFLAFADPGRISADEARPGADLLGSQAAPPAELPVFQGEPLPRLQALGAWMARTFLYRQIYLDPSRNLKPQPVAHTLRQHYGDCKDLAAVAIAAANKAGLQAFPVLARIGDGVLSGPVPYWSQMANHAICAIQVPAGLELAAAVQVGGDRYLLYDPTARTTPIGWLPAAHRGAQVVLCLPSGNQWVEVPAKAIQEARLDLQLEATLTPTGEAAGTCLVREFGDAAGLALNGLEGGREGLRRALVPLLALNPASDFSILEFTDPLAPGPFQVKVALRLEGALGMLGNAAGVDLPGLPSVPGAIQRLGEARTVAVEAGPILGWHWRCSLKPPAGWQLRHRELRLESALRTGRWQGERKNDTLELSMDMELKHGSWDAAKAAEGQQAVDADRFAYRDFRAGCLEFDRRP